jgi:hypothetical protein
LYGTENFDTADNFVSEITTIASKYSAETALNIIFAGTLVHLKDYCKEPRVNSPMLENRLCHYMDESNTLVNKERINLLKSMLTDII